jgi:hypothetical protein
MKLNQANSILDQLFKEYPHDFVQPEAMTEEMRDALAKAFSMPGFRKYLEHLVNKLVLNSAVLTDNMETLLIRKGRILAIKELLSRCFNCLEAITKQNEKKV